MAYSGGLDSAFVLKVATDELQHNAIGLTAISPSLAEHEHQDAVRIAREIGARHELVNSHELDDPNYAANGSDRCYFCKNELYTITARKQAEWSMRFVANGTNLDDLGDYRPGLAAASEAHVRSPLVEAQLTKAEVRQLAHALGMPVWDKPAAACLSSRIPYGTAVTSLRLQQIGRAEAALKTLGLRQVRVRYHSELARVEVAADELASAFAQREAIIDAVRANGFTFVTLDLEGYRTGSLNALLPTANLLRR